MKNKLQVIKTAMAFKHLNDTKAFTSLNIEVTDGSEEFASDVERLTDIFVKHDISTIFDLVETEKELDEMMSAFEFPTEDSAEDMEECLCENCCAENEETEDEQDDYAEETVEEFEKKFKLNTAIALVSLIELTENLNSNMNNLKKENSQMKAAITMIVKILEDGAEEA